MTDPSEKILVSNLTLRRGDCTILDKINWRVGVGEHWVILGANGSGKTSLLRVLTGYLMPTDGEIRVLGKWYGRSDWSEIRKKIGMVSASLGQMISEEETALEVVISGKFAMLNYWGPMRRSDVQQAEDMLAQVEASHLTKRTWGLLSQGERQRILIGRALMAAPQILILDEPCAGLDPAARGEFLDFLGGLAALPSGPALVFVTHHVEEILPAFSHALILKSGRILASGTMRNTLCSAHLSEAFDKPFRLDRRDARYHLRPL
ncbi:MAG: ABC transporter ATP-binding protein [Chthoniobacterales bacterium]